MVNKSLTKAEEQIMQTLWKLKTAYLKDILEALPEPKPHNNTVATLLKILINKASIFGETFMKSMLILVKNILINAKIKQWFLMLL